MLSTATIHDDRTPNGEQAKALGAFYTNEQVADFLAWWAIRSKTDTVMDPSFGGGVFLSAALRRIQRFEGNPRTSVYGVELDQDVYTRTAEKFVEEHSLNREHLICDDFFNVDAKITGKVSAIIGNPPFIRYQRFTEEGRRHAFARAKSRGVELPKLSSSWALFLVHSISMLQPGGRLAMVLPMEVAHAKYARPVLEHLRQSFKSTTFLTFRSKLFEDLSEDTVLILADGNENGPGSFQLRDFAHPSLLANVASCGRFRVAGSQAVNADAIANGHSRLIEYLLPRKARELYCELKASRRTSRLGELADVGIGYVTGANDFFHLTPDEARKRSIPDEFLKPVVRRGRALVGLKFTQSDWNIAANDGEAGFLLHIKKGQPLPPSVEEYLKIGRENGVADTYKCRTRSPWYSVPHVHRPDAFLSYMSGLSPYLVANQANAYAPNSLHVLRIHPMTFLTAESVAALWHTSLTRLSVEIEGHPLGGGMLKLEPTEAENVRVPYPDDSDLILLDSIADELDEMSRKNGHAAAVARADEQLLCKMIGLSQSDCKLLNSAAEQLRARRGYGSPLNELA